MDFYRFFFLNTFTDTFLYICSIFIKTVAFIRPQRAELVQFWTDDIPREEEDGATSSAIHHEPSNVGS